jgi:hypothetical protein
MEPTPTNRRAFLKLAGVTPLAGLPLHQQDTGKPTAEDPRRQYLDWLFDVLKEKGIELDEDIVLGCLWGAVETHKSLGRKEQEAQKQQQWRKQRDALSGQARVDFVVERLKDKIGSYVPSFQKKALRCIVNNRPLPSQDGEYVAGQITRCFDGTTKSFQQKVLRHYEKAVLPVLEAEYREELALEKATDEYLRPIYGKTTEQIKTLTSRVKALA